MVDDDLLLMRTYLHFVDKDFRISFIFYRTVHLPYTQSKTISWTVEHKDNKGNFRKETLTFDMKDRAEKKID